MILIVSCEHLNFWRIYEVKTSHINLQNIVSNNYQNFNSHCINLCYSIKIVDIFNWKINSTWNRWHTIITITIVIYVDKVFYVIIGCTNRFDWSQLYEIKSLYLLLFVIEIMPKN